MYHLDSPLKFESGEFIDKEIGLTAMTACHNAILKIRELDNPALLEIENGLQLAIDLLVGREISGS